MWRATIADVTTPAEIPQRGAVDQAPVRQGLALSCHPGRRSADRGDEHNEVIRPRWGASCRSVDPDAPGTWVGQRYVVHLVWVVPRLPDGKYAAGDVELSIEDGRAQSVDVVTRVHPDPDTLARNGSIVGGTGVDVDRMRGRVVARQQAALGENVCSVDGAEVLDHHDPAVGADVSVEKDLRGNHRGVPRPHIASP